MQFGWPSQGNRRHKLCSISATSTGWLIRSIALVWISTLQWNEWVDQSEESSRTNFCSEQARSKFQPGRILCSAVPFWCCVRHLWGEVILCSSFETTYQYSQVSDYHEKKDQFCPNMNFLCEKDDNPQFSRCMEAIDCKVFLPVKTFLHVH